MNDLLTTKQVAEKLHLTPAHVRRFYLSTGKIKSERVGKRKMVKVDELDRFLQGGDNAITTPQDDKALKSLIEDALRGDKDAAEKLQREYRKRDFDGRNYILMNFFGRECDMWQRAYEALMEAIEKDIPAEMVELAWLSHKIFA